jgi:ketosteroid isomerase-like protein
MSQEPTSPELVELMRDACEAVNRRDFDALLSFHAPDVVVSQRRRPSIEGVAAVRGFIEAWTGAYEEFRYELQEVLDLGSVVTFSVVRLDGRPAGSSGHVGHREGWVVVWVDGLIERHTTYRGTDEGRAAAERLAHSRGGR